jgi:DNA-binding CsgD family transcriptional regulator
VLWRLGWLGACGNGVLLDACDAWLAEAGAEAHGAPALMSRIERTRFLVAAQRYEPTRAASHARMALRAATRTDDPTATATSLAMVAWSDAVVGRGVRKGAIERAMALWPSVPDAPARWVGNEHPGYLCGAVLVYVDRLDEARVIFEGLLREADDAGSEWTASLARWWLCNVSILTGNWDLAARYADEGSAPANDWPGLHPRGLVAAHLGRVADARRSLAWSLERATAVGVTDLVHLVLQTLGFLELSLGDVVAAHRHLARVTEMFFAAGIVEPGTGRFLPDAIEALVGLGELGEAERLTAWLEERGRALGRASVIAAGARCRGLLRSAEGEHEGALADLERAMADHERVPMPFERARTLLVLGSVRRRAGHRRAAREALTEALDEFRRLGAALWADKARAELAAIGGRVTGDGHLSPMEERVARLAAAGRTNREIAETLFLSTRTVESHLSHAYRKLDVRSRTELALVLEDPMLASMPSAGDPLA